MSLPRVGASVSVARPLAAEPAPAAEPVSETPAAAATREPDANVGAALLRQLGVIVSNAAAAVGLPAAAGALDYSQLLGGTDNSRLGIGEAGPVDPKEHAALVASQRAVVDAGVALHPLEAGESIEALAQRFDSSVEELEKLNPGLTKLLQSPGAEALKGALVAVPVGASEVSGAPPQGITPQRGAGAYSTPAPALDQIRSGAATMHRGMGGPSVMDMQRMLNAQGANPPLVVDGKFGPKTEAALKAFQSANGVQQTGVLGQQTLNRFDNNPKRIPEPAPGTTTGAAENVSGQQLQGTAFGNQIAAAAEREARRLNSVGRCALGVNNALVSLGVPGRGHAYQKAEQLANNPRFREVNMSPAELRNLPPGAVVVWGRSDAKPYGHVSVALGGGREASDHIQSQITGGRYGTDFGNGPDPQGRQFRVFLPA